MNIVSVENMTGRTGRPVANQFIIRTRQGRYFQSYDALIAFIPHKGKIRIDYCYWNYSVTTGKYRNKFLDENKAETERKIKSGEYQLRNLNK